MKLVRGAGICIKLEGIAEYPTLICRIFYTYKCRRFNLEKNLNICKFS